MNARLVVAWDAARSSYWLVPLLLVLLASGVAVAALALDPGRPESRDLVDPTPFGSAASARQFLSSAAASSITLAGLVFSIAIVAMSLASNQYGPRLLRNFVQDVGNQVSLGAFVALFAFCLIVLGSVRGEGSTAIVPTLAVRIAFFFSLLDVFVLIYFIHHAASQIQVANVIEAAARDLDQAIDHRYPARMGVEPPPDWQPPEPVAAGVGQPIRAKKSGYVQAVDEAGLIGDAARLDVVLSLAVRPGTFVDPGTIIATASPPDRVSAADADRIAGRLLLGHQRTELQDLEFALQQIVQIAVRAMSAAYNDPFTAYACLDRLSIALEQLAEREPPSLYRFDHGGALRVVADAPTFEVLLSQAVSEVRHAGRNSLTVMVRLLEVLERIGRHAHHENDAAAVARQAERVVTQSAAQLGEAWEQAVLDDRLRRALAVAVATREGRQSHE